MTYEMAGGGRAGLALTLPDGTVLTLADRVARHLTTSLATVRTAAAQQPQAARGLRRQPRQGRPPSRRAPTSGRPTSRRRGRWPTCSPSTASACGSSRKAPRSRCAPLAKGARARRSRTASPPAPTRSRPPSRSATWSQALLELDSPMSQAFLDRQRQRLEQNLERRVLRHHRLVAAARLQPARPGWRRGTWRRTPARCRRRPAACEGEGDLGWLVPPQGIASYRLAAALQNRKVHFRVALAPFTVGGSGGASYPAGTLFVPRRATRTGSARRSQSPAPGGRLSTAQALSSSYELKGLSLGSNDMPAVRPVRVGLLSGEGVDATSFGFLWYLLDRQIGVNHDRLDLAQLRQIPLRTSTCWSSPDGSYDDRISDKLKTSLDGWIKDGGVLVAIGDAVTWLQDKELTSIKRWQPPKKDDKADAQPDDPESSESPADKQLAQRPIFTPGAVLATRMQPQHPLTARAPLLAGRPLRGHRSCSRRPAIRGRTC